MSYTPPIGIIGDDGVPRGCSFGVDMPPDPPPGEEFIARGRDADQISQRMEMPVVYISRQALAQAFAQAGVPEQELCTYCIGGPHPLAGFSASAQRAGQAAQLKLLESGNGLSS